MIPLLLYTALVFVTGALAGVMYSVHLMDKY
jgi:hypothetical protein